MKYRINNLKCIESKDDRKVIKKLIAKQTDRLARIGENYPKNFIINIHLSKSDKLHFDVSAVLFITWFKSVTTKLCILIPTFCCS